MTTATAARPGRGSVPAAAGSPVGRRRRSVVAIVALVVLLVAWEGVKLLGGTPWRAPGALPGPSNPVLWNPPFRWPFANDLNLPHVWNIVLAFFQPWQRGADRNVAQFLFDAALFTWREALVGFALGAAIGLVLASIFVHSRWLERAFVPVRRREPDGPDHRPRAR